MDTNKNRNGAPEDFVDQREPVVEHTAKGLKYRIALDQISRDALKSARATLNEGREVRHSHSAFVRVAIRDYAEKVRMMSSESEISAERQRVQRARMGVM